MYAAKKKGADIVKQWDATLDGQTRPNHRQLDGQIRELDEPFEVNGMKVDCPGGFGIASEDCNCRCCVLQRARWALDKDFTKLDNIKGELIEIGVDNYDDFKKQYFVKAAKLQKIKKVSVADKNQFKRYSDVLAENAPEILEKFCDIKYNNSDEWNALKYQYRTVNRYEINGDVLVNTILELDNAAFYTKKKGFDYSSLSGKEKRKIMNSISNGGNAATMEFDGKIYFSHSKFGTANFLEHTLYKGEYPTVTLSKNRKFAVKDLGDGIPREYDTEAKFLEFVASKKNPTEEFTLTILSEKHICESCQGVVEQFKTMYPHATVNIVSGKKAYNGSEKGLRTWKHRKKVK